MPANVSPKKLLVYKQLARKSNPILPLTLPGAGTYYFAQMDIEANRLGVRPLSDRSPNLRVSPLLSAKPYLRGENN